MAARVNIEEEAWTDPCFGILARALGIERDTALIRCARLWSWQTDEYTPEKPTYVVDRDTIEEFIGVGGAEALVRARLAEEVPEGFRIKGSVGRIEWLYWNRVNGGKGGRASADKRSRGHKEQPPAQPPAQAKSNPLGSDLRTPDSPLRITEVETGGAEIQRARARSQAPTRTPTPLQSGWVPEPSVENAQAATEAQARGVAIPYALSKFVAKNAGRQLDDPNREWRVFVVSEYPTPKPLVEALTRVEREKHAQAARDRERGELAEQKQRAESDREEVRRAAKAALTNGFRLPAEEGKATG